MKIVLSFLVVALSTDMGMSMVLNRLAINGLLMDYGESMAIFRDLGIYFLKEVIIKELGFANDTFIQLQTSVNRHESSNCMTE